MWEFDTKNVFHLQIEKDVKICEWDGVFTQCIHSLKIAIIIYRCIKNSASMMLTNKIEHYTKKCICNSGIILKLDKPKQKIPDDFFSCSVVTWVLLKVRLSSTAKK